MEIGREGERKSRSGVADKTEKGEEIKGSVEVKVERMKQWRR